MSILSAGPLRTSLTGRPLRYVTRPAIYLERLKIRSDNKVQYELKNPFSGGRNLTEPQGRAVTQSVFTFGFSKKTCCTSSQPRHNLARYQGVLARGCRKLNVKIRKLIVPKNNKRLAKKIEDKGDDKKHNVAVEAVS
jgi:hypothetical protein